MPRPLKIAITGAGTAGLAAACFLTQSGHDVTLFERFESPKPLGAGLLLQPAGLAVLAKLGLDKAAIASSSPIRTLYGQVANGGPVIFNLSYAELAPRLFGAGIHRGVFFSLLHDEARRLAVRIVTSAPAICVRQQPDGAILVCEHAEYGPFDLIVDAGGARSALRNLHGDVRLSLPYPYGAVWGICGDPHGRASAHTLSQRYHKARHMMGLLPVGTLKGDSHPSMAFFWSLRVKDYPAWRDADIGIWHEQCAKLWPEAESFTRQFTHTGALTFASYSDVILRRWHAKRIAFIGDAAHSTSPQLGQGANLALIDAMTLDHCLKTYADLDEALANYTRQRKSHVRFYQMASRWLTPFFQSDSRTAALLRNMSFGPLSKVPFIRREMLRTLSGIKTGMLTHLNPGDWHQDYDVNRKEPP